MTLESLITAASRQGASDLHLEPSLPAAVRLRGALRTTGEPLSGKLLIEFAQGVLDGDAWQHFLERRSADFSRTIGGVRCRLNILHTARGVGFVIRLLASFQATVDRLNLHPDLMKLMVPTTGLSLVSGGSSFFNRDLRIMLPPF